MRQLQAVMQFQEAWRRGILYLFLVLGVSLSCAVQLGITMMAPLRKKKKE